MTRMNKIEHSNCWLYQILDQSYLFTHQSHIMSTTKIGTINTVNVPASIAAKIGRNLHRKDSHPINIIKNLVYGYFDSLKDRKFKKFDNLYPVVSVKSNFDLLLIPQDHPARSTSDTYYIDQTHVLRTHTSAHQNELLSSGESAFLVAGDVYRKDEIDSTHYPVFHQMEGLWVCTEENMSNQELEADLIKTLKGLCHHLFPGCEVKVGDDYFPFTHPSFQMDVYHKGRWIEILGCGIIQSQILKNCSIDNPTLMSTKNNGELKRGWAFGIGLDRLAMILFEIPDIRMIWVEDEKFTSQFKSNQITKFTPYSILDTISKDVSFYIPSEQVIESPITKIDDIEKYTDKKTKIVRAWSKENDMYESIRESANTIYPDIVSRVEMFDQFYNQKLSKLSRAYRIHYSPPNPSMSNPGEFTALVNKLHTDIAKDLTTNLGVDIR